LRSLSCQTWTSPQAAVEWATRVLGEKEQRTCDACTKTETTPGVGLTPLIQEEYDAKLQALQDLVSKAKQHDVREPARGWQCIAAHHPRRDRGAA
jgi:hypothetical protein